MISITSFLFFANFNSIKVQLELYLHSYLRQSRQNFNSIKVQLEHDSVFRQVFQPLFQFHKGTIRTYERLCVEHLMSYFNSIKVQLEHSFSGMEGGCI